MKATPAVVVALAACGTQFDGPDVDRPRLPSRAVAPWLPTPLEVCLGVDCGDQVAQRVQGADVRFDGTEFRVVAAVDGSLFTGTLTEGWRLQLDPASVVYPLLPWQSSGLADPDWVVGTDGEWAVFAAADGSAIGAAKRVAGILSVDNVPIWTAAELGHSAIGEPTGLDTGDRVAVAFSGDAATIELSWGASLFDGEAPLTVLRPEDVEDEGWRELRALQDPDLGLTADGTIRMFFASFGKESQDATTSTATPNDSIGYAAFDGAVFLPFAHNPVHDHVDAFIFHANETEPSVAIGDRVAVMLCREANRLGVGLSLAVHELD